MYEKCWLYGVIVLSHSNAYICPYLTLQPISCKIKHLLLDTVTDLFICDREMVEICEGSIPLPSPPYPPLSLSLPLPQRYRIKVGWDGTESTGFANFAPRSEIFSIVCFSNYLFNRYINSINKFYCNIIHMYICIVILYIYEE